MPVVDSRVVAEQTIVSCVRTYSRWQGQRRSMLGSCSADYDGVKIGEKGLGGCGWDGFVGCNAEGLTFGF